MKYCLVIINCILLLASHAQSPSMLNTYWHLHEDSPRVIFAGKSTGINSAAFAAKYTPYSSWKSIYPITASPHPIEVRLTHISYRPSDMPVCTYLWFDTAFHFMELSVKGKALPVKCRPDGIYDTLVLNGIFSLSQIDEEHTLFDTVYTYSSSGWKKMPGYRLHSDHEDRYIIEYKAGDRFNKLAISDVYENTHFDNQLIRRYFAIIRAMRRD